MKINRFISLLIFVVLLFALNTSFSRPFIPGLLTDDFGIVTQQDIDRETEVVHLPEVTDPNQFQFPTTFPFWRCVRPDQIHMNCVDLETEEPAGNPIYAPELAIVEGSNEYQLYTRRPWGLDACEETLQGWKNVIAREPVVCFSATIDDIEEERIGQRAQQVISGQINRMKSRVGSWSYFWEEGNRQ